MINILELTTSAQVRAVMGVTKTVLSDTMFEDMALEDDLVETIYAWLPTWEDVRDNGSDREKRMLRLYAKYEVAGIVASAAQNFLLVRMTDGANEGELADMDLETFEAMISRLKSRAYNYRVSLLSELDDSPETESAGLTLFGGVTPARDPVTEGRS